MSKYDYVTVKREDVKKLPQGKGADRFIRRMKIFTRVNVWVYKLSFGKLMNTAMGGYTIRVVEVIGKKTGPGRSVMTRNANYGPT